MFRRVTKATSAVANSTVVATLVTRPFGLCFHAACQPFSAKDHQMHTLAP